MDTKKLFLYALFGIICFSLWDAWQKDYHPQAVPATTETVNVANSSDKNVNQNIQNTVNRINTSNSQQDQTTSQTKPVEHKIINVQTDVFNVAIDLAGGNITQTKLLDYKEELKSDIPVTLLNNNENEFYIATSKLIKDNTTANEQANVQYTAKNKTYVLQPNQDTLQVVLERNDNNVKIAKTYTFTRGKYDIQVDYKIDNNSQQDWHGFFIAELQRKNIEQKSHGLGYGGTYTGGAISSSEKPYEKLPYKKLAENDLNRTINGGWLALQQRYFLSAWIPASNANNHYFSKFEPTSNLYTLGVKSPIITVPASQNTIISSKLYVGPEIASNLKPLAPHLDKSIDYGWLWIISIFLFWLMDKINSLIGNWGWSIILVTIFIKLVFFKLSESSYKSMARMKDLGPKMQALKERYKDDKQKLSQATMEMYRKEKVNPLGGCLPMIIQIPVFIGLYYVLMEAVQLRQAPFMFWLHDLSAKDPFYILPILMGISMFLQQKLSPQSPDPMQAKMMMFLPIIFTVFFLSFPSGLVLYWLVNNCLSILQQWYINKKHALMPVKKVKA